MVFEAAFVDTLREQIPELPLAKRLRYRNDLGLSEYDAGVLTADQEWAGYFEEAVAAGGDPKAMCNWMTGDLAKLLNESGQTPRGSKIPPGYLVSLGALIKEGTISGKIGKELLPQMFETGKSPTELVQEQGATQISDRGSIVSAVHDVFAANPEAVAKYRAGLVNVKGFLVGQVMKATGGRANPGLVQEIVQEELE
jgi:aspartyl-tRNA(Asn)/glutamyl-tRNA(Gln) amidotransferase subunit B